VNRHLTDRKLFQDKLIGLNPAWYAELQTKLQELCNKKAENTSSSRADGDIEPSLNTDYSTFDLPTCSDCGGFLKPNVVMFGENVPKGVADKSFELVDKSDGLLVLGTSLHVLSIYRLVKHAHQQGIPFAIINIGPTRADDLALFKFEHQLGPFMTSVVSQL